MQPSLGDALAASRSGPWPGQSLAAPPSSRAGLSRSSCGDGGLSAVLVRAGRGLHGCGKAGTGGTCPCWEPGPGEVRVAVLVALAPPQSPLVRSQMQPEEEHVRPLAFTG